MKITTWAEEDRPREKLLLKGRHVLSNAELIAILLGSGNREESAVELAKKILMSVDNDLSQLAKLNVKQLRKFKGIGNAKAISICAAIELGRRRKDSHDASLQQKQISSSEAAFLIMESHFLDLNHEQFWILLLNRSNKIIDKKCISTGGVSGTVVDAKLIFKYALENLASGIIMFHNHPSGNLKPSQQDISLTKKLVEASKNLDINILDHLIISQHKYFSFKDDGVI